MIEETDTMTTHLFPEKEIRCQGHDRKIPNFLFIDCPCCEGILEFNAEYKHGLWIYWSCSKCDLYWHVDGEPIVQDGIRNGLRPLPKGSPL